ncbi:jg9311 [Pararge aegeria aegeria]|uniref:Jg9311 protein n=1 Tax=Pararge aegeria aegeria TaxID=348720 RepID=A0A8S4QY23_9NEOP|nr:jg9311 [Pararge aegeria aegeria]
MATPPAHVPTAASVASMELAAITLTSGQTSPGFGSSGRRQCWRHKNYQMMPEEGCSFDLQNGSERVIKR